MSEQEKQGPQGASSPSVNAPAKVPAAGCDDAVREVPTFACPRCRMDCDHEPGCFCECAEQTPTVPFDFLYADDHGLATTNPCAAACRRCGWTGTLPHRALRMPDWMRSAINAKWKPPTAAAPKETP